MRSKPLCFDRVGRGRQFPSYRGNAQAAADPPRSEHHLKSRGPSSSSPLCRWSPIKNHLVPVIAAADWTRRPCDPLSGVAPRRVLVRAGLRSGPGFRQAALPPLARVDKARERDRRGRTVTDSRPSAEADAKPDRAADDSVDTKPLGSAAHCALDHDPHAPQPG